jgi:SH3 and multiple ankyrin repeat domains protein
MLTPVYLSVMKKSDPKVTEILLHDHGSLGTQDTQGWNEVHQVMKKKNVTWVTHIECAKLAFIESD